MKPDTVLSDGTAPATGNTWEWARNGSVLVNSQGKIIGRVTEIGGEFNAVAGELLGAFYTSEQAKAAVERALRYPSLG